jgi:hypothetical protein
VIFQVAILQEVVNSFLPSFKATAFPAHFQFSPLTTPTALEKQHTFSRTAVAHPF